VIEWSDYIENICEQNGIKQADLTSENWAEMKEFYEKQTGAKKVKEVNGFEMLAQSHGVSVGEIKKSVLEEDDLRELEKNIRLRKAKALTEQYVSVDEIKKQITNDDLSNVSVDMAEMYQDVKDRDKAIDFLFPETNSSIILAPASVVLMCAPTNNGKSTLCASLGESLVSQNKRVLILANEEVESDVRARVSCIRTGISFAGYKDRNGITLESRKLVIEDAKSIENNLVVITNKDHLGAYRTCNKDGIVTTLEKTAGKFDLIIIDYWQRIVKTDVNPEANWEAQRALAPELDRLKKIVGCPIVVFAQIHSIVNKNKDDDRAKAFDLNHPFYRWKGSSEILFTATDILEFAKDWENSCTHFFAHKTRFTPIDWQQHFILGFDKEKNNYRPYNVNFQIDNIVGSESEADEEETADAD